jgi:predicted transcriptional regulator
VDGDLSDLQLAFMRALWRRDEATVGEVRAELDELGRVLKPTTVATVLKRLEAKGLVAHRQEGRSFRYRALRSEQDVRRTVVARVKDLIFGGDLAALVASLLDPDAVSNDDLDRVRELLETREQDSTAADGAELDIPHQQEDPPEPA